jgi:acyl carrier protein
MKTEILEILQETRPESDFSNSDDFITGALLDSFDIVVLVDELENKFGVKIEGVKILPENFVSIDAIIRLIESSK